MSQPEYIVPDYAEPIIGWRGWGYSVGDTMTAFSQTSVHWPGYAALEAKCLRTQFVIYMPNAGFGPAKPATCKHDPENVPADDCSCGIHAKSTAAELAGHIGIWNCQIVGRVSLWGPMIEGSVGWKAKFAYPLELWVTQRPPAVRGSKNRKYREHLRARLSATYGVPVHASDMSTIPFLRAVEADRIVV